MKRATLVPPIRLVFLIWVVFSIQTFTTIDLGFLGIFPRTVNGLLGVFTAPLVHGDWGHIVSNTIPLLFLGTTVYFFYSRIASQVFIQCYFLTNILVWIIGRPFYHIGASGFVYALAFFLIALGIFRRDFKSIFISIVIIFIYGGLVYGLSPTLVGISSGHRHGFCYEQVEED
jgi:membrane associated rhomboid family serine protease